eukprot:GILJ01002151.1.p1 GENE.GILJ01002151.1~~GILJ01002151.1.p1  ORF type:complete len:123 (-),score=15.96 GILJ01002151.1:202-570(-)
MSNTSILAHTRPPAKASKEDLLQWMSTSLNRFPEPSDLYHISKELYHLGDFGNACHGLELYVEQPGALLPGHHLLGYSYYYNGQLAEAVRQLKKCVKEGFDSDWQLLVELTVQLETTPSPPS